MADELPVWDEREKGLYPTTYSLSIRLHGNPYVHANVD